MDQRLEQIREAGGLAASVQVANINTGPR